MQTIAETDGTLCRRNALLVAAMIQEGIGSMQQRIARLGQLFTGPEQRATPPARIPLVLGQTKPLNSWTLRPFQCFLTACVSLDSQPAGQLG